MVGQQCEAERTDCHADHHEAQNRTEPQTMEQRDHDGGGRQDDQGRFELPWVDVCAQVSEPVRGEEAVERLRDEAWSLDRGEMS